ncbi:MAG TPA: glutathione peroxidase, partial [Rhodospirillales bacterium]|nr:glutathione peroxidase [Rhodospirillales bacterium]
MRCILVILASVLSAMTVNAGEQSKNAYDFSFKTISGEPLPFSEFRGKLVMVVNTASECGFTGQYKNLQTVWS